MSLSLKWMGTGDSRSHYLYLNRKAEMKMSKKVNYEFFRCTIPLSRARIFHMCHSSGCEYVSNAKDPKGLTDFFIVTGWFLQTCQLTGGGDHRFIQAQPLLSLSFSSTHITTEARLLLHQHGLVSLPRLNQGLCHSWAGACMCVIYKTVKNALKQTNNQTL